MKNFASLRFFLVIFLVMFFTVECTVKYSFTGALVGSNEKTYTMYDFPNRARTVNPTLSDYFTETFRARVTRQTSLEHIKSNGDLEFEGSITGYDIKPMSIKSNDEAAQNRLTIQIRVKFTNNKDHDKDFESDFSHYSDFSSDLMFSDVEESLVKEIVEEIINQVYNKALANW